MKTGIVLILLYLFSSLVLAEPVALPEIQTSETLGFRGPVSTVIETETPCGVKDGHWIPAGKPIVKSWEFDAAGRLVKKNIGGRETVYQFRSEWPPVSFQLG